MKSPGEISAMLYGVPDEDREKRPLINKSEIQRKMSGAIRDLRRVAQRGTGGNEGKPLNG